MKASHHSPIRPEVDDPKSTGPESQRRLIETWHAIEEGEPVDHTSVVIPSLSFDPEEIAKIAGASFYEERLLFSLIRLRHPRARVLYVTSQPIHPEILDYYLHLLAGVPARQVRQRFHHLCLYDASPRPLTNKILERPRFIERMRSWIGDPTHAYLTCFNSTALEAQLADRLGIALNGVAPELLYLGGKSGCRKLFRGAGVPLPEGQEDLHSIDDILDTLEYLAEARPGLHRAVIKLDDSFAGAGNALYTYPHPLAEDANERREQLRGALDGLRFTDEGGNPATFLAKMEEMGGIVEEMLLADEVLSPSVQMRIHPDRELALVSTHDQILEGDTGQSYAGCRFPANAEYRELIQEEAWKIGEALRDHGVVSRFAIDFLTTRQAGGPWQVHAIEINLRMGGTTAPFLALQFLTGGHLAQDSGQFHCPRGRRKFYRATDSLTSPIWRGLLPDDLLDILFEHDLTFQPSTETGAIFHMIGALSQFGKVGVTCIGDSRDEAEDIYRRVVEVIDQECTPKPKGSAVRRKAPME